MSPSSTSSDKDSSVTASELFPPSEKYAVYLDADQMAFVNDVRAYVEQEMMPKRAEFEGGWHRDEQRAHTAIDNAYAGLVDLGVQEAVLPEEYGGRGVIDGAHPAMYEEIARADAGIATDIAKVHWMSALLSMGDIMGDGELIERFLPKVAKKDPKAVAVLITEPQGGANVEDPTQDGRAVEVTAEQDGDEYIINGVKRWGGPGGPSEVFEREQLDGHLGYFVVTNMNPERGEEGLAIFHVSPDADGLSFGDPYEKMGMSHTDRNVKYWFDNVRVPEANRVDEESVTTHAANLLKGPVMTAGKLVSAAMLIGTAQAAVETVIEYTSHRTIMGKPVRERPLFATRLGECIRDLEAARSYLFSIWQAAQDSTHYGQMWSDKLSGRAGATRSVAADAATSTFETCFELMGAQGYAYETGIEKLYRDSKIMKLWLGGPQRDRLDTALMFFEHTWETPDDFEWHYE